MGSNYDEYVERLRSVYAAIAQILKPDAHAVVNIANIRNGDTTTPLAWDVARALASVLRFEQEVVIDSEFVAPWVTVDYCLIFDNARSTL